MSPRSWAAALLLWSWAALAPDLGRAADPAPAYHFVPGQRASYAVAYASSGDADFSVLMTDRGDAAPAASTLAYRLATSLAGRMDVTIVAASATDVEAWCVVRAPLVRLAINGRPQADETARLAGQLAHGFLVELKPDGTIAGLRMGADADAASQAFLRALLAIAQVVAPATSGSAWETREEDPNGPYTAEYRRLPDPAHPGRTLLRKRIAGYLAAAAVPALPGETTMRQVVTPSLDLTARLDPTGAGVMALEATETDDTAVEGKHVAHAQTLLRLTRTAFAALAPAQLAAARAAANALAASGLAARLYQPRTPQDVEANIERNALGEDTPADLTSRLAALDAAGAGADKAETDALYLKLKALIYLSPAAAAPLGARLAGAPVASPGFSLLAGALGSVGSPAAQGALALAIRARPTDWPALSALVPELCTPPAPTDDAETAVHSLTGSADPNISAMAWLCLGGMARGLADAAPDRSQAILAELTTRLAASGDENAEALLLQALGNANSALTMAAVKPYAASASPVLRAAAMDAMRGVPLPDVDPILRNALATDPDAKVRLEAAFALGFRAPDAGLFAAERAALAGEADPEIRAALLNDLAKLAGPFPQARALIQAAAVGDPADEVRKTAAGLLPSLGAAP